MSTALLNPNGSYSLNVTINHNSTINNVTEIVGTSFVYVLLSLFLTFFTYMYIGQSVRSYFIPSDGDASVKNENFHESITSIAKGGKKDGEFIVRALMGIAVPWAMFGTAWGLYSANVLGKAWIYTGQTSPGVRMVTPQDTFNYAFSGICCGTITLGSFVYAASASNWKYSVRLANLVLTTLTTMAVVMFPGAYAFATNQDVTVSDNGYLVAFTLTSGIILTFIVLARVVHAYYPSRSDKENDDFIYNDAIVKDVTVLATGVQGDLAGATFGYAPGIHLPLTWIIAHYLYLTSAGLIIYLDNTKPFVFTAVVCIVPWILTLRSRQIYSYMAWHVAMSAYWILVNVLGASVTGPGVHTPVVTSFVASGGATYYNITLNKVTTQSEFFLTGPSPTMLPDMRTTTDLFSISAICLSFVIILLNMMVYEPAWTSGMKDPAIKSS